MIPHASLVYRLGLGGVGHGADPIEPLHGIRAPVAGVIRIRWIPAAA